MIKDFFNKVRTPLDIVDGIRVAANNVERKIAATIDDKLISISPDLAVLENTIVKKNKVEDTLMNLAKGVKQTVSSEEIVQQLKHRINGSCEDLSKFELADHLYVQRITYTHHGIYVGNGEVIHYLRSGVVKSSLKDFADGAIVRIMHEFQSPLSHSRRSAVDRAYSRLYEGNYNLIINNCEHFVRYCRS